MFTLSDGDCKKHKKKCGTYSQMKLLLNGIFFSKYECFGLCKSLNMLEAKPGLFIIISL